MRIPFLKRSRATKPVIPAEEADPIDDKPMPLLDHLIELRTRLMWSFGAFMIAFLVCYYFSGAIYGFLAAPLAHVEERMGGSQRMIYTGLTEGFFTYLKVSMFGALFIAFPIMANQLWLFVAPGLYRSEKRAFLPFLIASPVLFAMGAALVYFVMLPFVLWFSLNQQIISADVEVQMLPKVSDYLDLVTKLVLAFGLCFQLPVVVTLAGLAGLIEAKTLASGRRYALLGIVVVSAVVTPPDMISPFLLAGPIYALYEASIWCVRLIELRRKREDAAAA